MNVNVRFKTKPTYTYVFGFQIPIQYVKGLKENEGCYGDYDSDKRFIRIDDALEGLLLLRTLIHEQFHAMWDISGQTGYTTDKKEHAIINMLENGLELWILNMFVNLDIVVEE